jgi:hypothetical protein
MGMNCVLLAREMAREWKAGADRGRNRVAFAWGHYKAKSLDCSVARNPDLPQAGSRGGGECALSFVGTDRKATSIAQR